MDVRTNERLRDLLRQAGWTNEAAARAINRIAAEHGEITRANKSSLTHWMNGTRPNPRTLGYLCEALSRRLGRSVHPKDAGYGEAGDSFDVLPDDALGALTTLGRADVNRRTALTTAVYSLGALMLPVNDTHNLAGRAERALTGQIGLGEVEAVVDITAAFNRADERLGGGFGRTAVVEYLTTDVATYCKARSTPAVRSQMFSSAAQLAYLAGWKAHDIGREGLAQRYYLHGYQLARESGDHGQAAYIMRILAHQAYDMGHSDNCVDLAETALRAGIDHVDRHTGALLTLTLAKAHAMRGNRADALATISLAETRLSRASDDEERPAWAGMHGLSPAQFNNHVAKILVDLGDHAGAIEHFNRSLRLYLNPTTQPRIYALATTWLAEAQCQRGHVEAACESWTDALARMEGIQSSRTQEAVQNMRRMLAPFQNRGIPAVRRLLAVSGSER